MGSREVRGSGQKDRRRSEFSIPFSTMIWQLPMVWPLFSQHFFASFTHEMLFFSKFQHSTKNTPRGLGIFRYFWNWETRNHPKISTNHTGITGWKPFNCENREAFKWNPLMLESLGLLSSMQIPCLRREMTQKNPIITALHRYVLHRIFRSSWDLNLNILHRMKLKLHKSQDPMDPRKKKTPKSVENTSHFAFLVVKNDFPSHDCLGWSPPRWAHGILGFLASPAPAIHWYQ